MEPDDLKTAWHALERKLERQNLLQVELLRERKLDDVRRRLRPLLVGQWVQVALGIALIALGVACWTRNTDIAGLLVSGIALHAFGVLTVAMAAATLVLAGTIDYAAPVVEIQKRMARLLRVFMLNAALCGAPWWVMWVFVVLGFAGLGEVDPQAPTPGWIWACLAIGGVGLLATWGWFLRAEQRASDRPLAPMHDGADGIRSGRRLLDDIARFEQES